MDSGDHLVLPDVVVQSARFLGPRVVFFDVLVYLVEHGLLPVQLLELHPIYFMQQQNHTHEKTEVDYDLDNGRRTIWLTVACIDRDLLYC